MPKAKKKNHVPGTTYEYRALLLRWIDGDTLLVRLDLGFNCSREERIRLAGINAWELNSNSTYQRRIARSVRFRARKMCPENSFLFLKSNKNPKKDMYARYIAEVYFFDENLGKMMNLSERLMELKGVEKF